MDDTRDADPQRVLAGRPRLPAGARPQRAPGPAPVALALVPQHAPDPAQAEPSPLAATPAATVASSVMRPLLPRRRVPRGRGAVPSPRLRAPKLIQKEMGLHLDLVTARNIFGFQNLSKECCSSKGRPGRVAYAMRTVGIARRWIDRRSMPTVLWPNDTGAGRGRGPTGGDAVKGEQ